MKRTLAMTLLAVCVAVRAETVEDASSSDTTTNDVVVIDVPAVTMTMWLSRWPPTVWS